MTIIAEFFQFGNMYVAPNYNFLYTRKTSHQESMMSPNSAKLDQKIHVGMMDVMDQFDTMLNQTIELIASNELVDSAVLQITNTN